MGEQFGYYLSGPRRGEPVDGRALHDALLGSDLAWVHLNFLGDGPDEARGRLERILPELEASTVGALTGDVTRPRLSPVGEDGLLMLLRDTPAAMSDDADDMPSIRLYVDRRMIVTLARRPSRSLDALRIECTRRDRVLSTPSAFLHDLLTTISENAADLIEGLAQRTDDLEDLLDEGKAVEAAARQEATILRRTVVALRRYLGPQRDALETLRQLEMFPKGERRRMAEVADRNTRIVEELDLLTSRLIIVRETISSLQADRLNRQLVFLSVVSVFFLPLGFLTSLLGVNLGGIPGAGNPRGFWIFCGMLGCVAVVLTLVIWRMRRR